ncbi:chemotaxis protein CheW [Sphingomonas sp. Xoc002]|uniref:chemotaxis protein CheW n=1 Tax=Sphingomonas sp. Xoc002 TaxID=2837624 RepID=UPI003D1699D3
MSGHIEAVVFAIDGGLFALPVTVVREILDRRPAFRVPSAPDWMVGLIDLRGQSVAVIDLRAFASTTMAEAGTDARILIVEAEPHGAWLGLLVDQVVDVACHAHADRQEMPAIVPQHGPWRLSGVLRREGGFVGLLDMDAISGLADEVCAAGSAVAA